VHYYATFTSFHTDNYDILRVLEIILVAPALPLINFLVVSVATAVAVVKLRMAVTWRRKATTFSFTDSSSDSDRRYENDGDGGDDDDNLFVGVSGYDDNLD
jgi:hypothetical protein